MISLRYTLQAVLQMPVQINGQTQQRSFVKEFPVPLSKNRILFSWVQISLYCCTSFFVAFRADMILTRAL